MFKPRPLSSLSSILLPVIFKFDLTWCGLFSHPFSSLLVLEIVFQWTQPKMFTCTNLLSKYNVGQESVYAGILSSHPLLHHNYADKWIQTKNLSVKQVAEMGRKRRNYYNPHYNTMFHSNPSLAIYLLSLSVFSEKLWWGKHSKSTGR